MKEKIIEIHTYFTIRENRLAFVNGLKANVNNVSNDLQKLKYIYKFVFGYDLSTSCRTCIEEGVTAISSISSEKLLAMLSRKYTIKKPIQQFGVGLRGNANTTDEEIEQILIDSPGYLGTHIFENEYYVESKPSEPIDNKLSEPIEEEKDIAFEQLKKNGKRNNK
jgi:hypothetical protein